MNNVLITRTTLCLAIAVHHPASLQPIIRLPSRRLFREESHLSHDYVHRAFQDTIDTYCLYNDTKTISYVTRILGSLLDLQEAYLPSSRI